MIQIITRRGARQIAEAGERAEAIALGTEALDALPEHLPQAVAPLAGAIAKLTSKFRDLVIAARGISIKIAIDTARLHRHAESVAADAERQQQEVAHVATATESVTQLSSTVAANATDMAATAARNLDAAESARADVADMEERIAEIKAQMVRFTAIVDDLFTRTHAVDRLGKLIRGIADQIHQHLGKMNRRASEAQKFRGQMGLKMNFGMISFDCIELRRSEVIRNGGVQVENLVYQHTSASKREQILNH